VNTSLIVKIVLGLIATIPVSIIIFILYWSYKAKLKSFITRKKRWTFRIAYLLAILTPVIVIATVDGWKFERDSLTYCMFTLAYIPAVIRHLFIKERKLGWKLSLTINAMGASGILYLLINMICRAFGIAQV